MCKLSLRTEAAAGPAHARQSIHSSAVSCKAREQNFVRSEWASGLKGVVYRAKLERQLDGTLNSIDT
eukprot:315560-Pleurochrysis_carterae.AAC.2